MVACAVTGPLVAQPGTNRMKLTFARISRNHSRRWQRVLAAPLLVAMASGSLTACGDGIESNVTAERLPDPEPNLPDVPTIPPPPHPTRYPDQTYSVYGVRHMMSTTMDHDVSVTGYIVEIYQPPECDTQEACPRALAPHIYLADEASESDDRKRLMVAGYASRQGEIEEARRGRQEVVEGVPMIPTDFEVGNKVTIRGAFQRYSGVGFSASNGLIEFSSHTTLETASDS